MIEKAPKQPCLTDLGEQIYQAASKLRVIEELIDNALSRLEL